MEVQTNPKKKKASRPHTFLLFLVKYSEITHRISYRQAGTLGWQFEKAHLGGLADFLGHSWSLWHQEETHFSLSMCPAFKRRQVPTLKQNPSSPLARNCERGTDSSNRKPEFAVQFLSPSQTRKVWHQQENKYCCWVWNWSSRSFPKKCEPSFLPLPAIFSP